MHQVLPIRAIPFVLAWLTLWLSQLAVAGPTLQSVALVPGKTELLTMAADENEIRIQWTGAQKPHLLLVEQLGTDVVLRRNNNLVVHNAPSGGYGPELALIQDSELINVARKVAARDLWRLRVSTVPITEPQRTVLADFETAHQANSAGNANGQELAVKALARALSAQAILPESLALDCPLRYSLGNLARRLNRLDQAIQHYQGTMAACADVGWRARASNGLGLVYLQQQDFEPARRQFTLARTGALATEDAYEAASAANNLCLTLHHEGDLAAAKVCYQNAISEYRAGGQDTHAAVALINLGAAADALGEPDLAMHSYDEAIAIRREGQDSLGIAQVLINLARAQVGVGALQAALLAINEAEWRLQAIGNPEALARAMLVKADVHRQMGDEAALQRDVDALLKLTANWQSPRTEAQAWMLRASLMPAAEALPWQERAAEVWRNTEQPAPLAESLLELSRSNAALGKTEQAASAASEALALARERGFLALQADALLQLSRLQQGQQSADALKQARESVQLNASLRRLREQTEAELQVATLLFNQGEQAASEASLRQAATWSLQVLAQPMSQRLRHLQALQSSKILSRWTDSVLADSDAEAILQHPSLPSLVAAWTHLNQWRNRVDQLDAKATLQLSEWRAKLVLLQQAGQAEAERERLRARVDWLAQQLDLLSGSDQPPIPPEQALRLRGHSSLPTKSEAQATVWLLPGQLHVYAWVESHRVDLPARRQLLQLPDRSTLQSWQSSIRKAPGDLRFWAELDQRMRPLQQLLGEAQSVDVFDPELLGVPWVGLLADQDGTMLIERSPIRYLQAWPPTPATQLALSPLRLGWPMAASRNEQSTNDATEDAEHLALRQALPTLSIKDDLEAAEADGPWVLQVPGHHLIDESGLAQVIALPSRSARWFGPERLDLYSEPPRMVFLNACRGHAGTSGLGLLNLVARPGVRAAIINVWDVPDTAATRFAVAFYERLSKQPDSPIVALAQTQASFAARGRRRLLQEWGGYALIELAQTDTDATSLRD